MQEMQEICVRSLGQEDPLEKKMAIHSSILAWEIPWTEELGRLPSMGVAKGQTKLSMHMHTYTYPYTDTCIHTYTHIQIHAYIYISIYRYMHTYTYAYTKTCIHTHTHNAYTHIPIYRDVHTHTYLYTETCIHTHSFPGSSDGKETACKVGDPGLIPGLGRNPWKRVWLPTSVFLPGESHGQQSLVD